MFFLCAASVTSATALHAAISNRQLIVFKKLSMPALVSPEVASLASKFMLGKEALTHNKI